MKGSYRVFGMKDNLSELSAALHSNKNKVDEDCVPKVGTEYYIPLSLKHPFYSPGTNISKNGDYDLSSPGTMGLLLLPTCGYLHVKGLNR